MNDPLSALALSKVAMGEKAEGGNALRRLRLESGLSVRELASRADVAVSTINRIERGDRGIGGRSRRQIAAVLGCRESDLIEIANQTTLPFTDLLDALTKLIAAGAHDIAAETADLLAARLREAHAFTGHPPAGAKALRRP